MWLVMQHSLARVHREFYVRTAEESVKAVTTAAMKCHRRRVLAYLLKFSRTVFPVHVSQMHNHHGAIAYILHCLLQAVVQLLQRWCCAQAEVCIYAYIQHLHNTKGIYHIATITTDIHI